VGEGGGDKGKGRVQHGVGGHTPEGGRRAEYACVPAEGAWTVCPQYTAQASVGLQHLDQSILAVAACLKPLLLLLLLLVVVLKPVVTCVCHRPVASSLCVCGGVDAGLQ
jgi:hypothetical protein